MKIRRDPATKRKVSLVMKSGFKVPKIHLGIYKNYQNIQPLIFYRHTSTHLCGGGVDLPNGADLDHS